jgi:hypothetical protein
MTRPIQEVQNCRRFRQPLHSSAQRTGGNWKTSSYFKQPFFPMIKAHQIECSRYLERAYLLEGLAEFF